MSDNENGNGNSIIPPNVNGHGENAESSVENSKVAKPWLVPHRFPPGVSGNPGGRKKKVITEAYEELAELACPEDPEKRTYAKLAALGQFKSAIKGKTDAIKEITDRIEGPVNRDLIDSGGAPITINITFE